MSDTKFYTPEYIPPEISAFESNLLQLQPGKAGKIGALVLKFEENSKTGKTIVADQFSRVPLFAQRALYMEETYPSMAYVYMMSPSGGILQGDRYRIDITLTNSAKAHLTTQGATRIYRMDKNYACQMVNIHVDEDCYLEYIPDQIIPYRDSRFYQIVNAKVHDKGSLVYSEILTPGRMASDEHFQYDILYLTTQATNQNGKLRFTDAYILQPKRRNFHLIGLLGENLVVGNLYALTKPEYIKTLVGEISNCLKTYPNTQAGISILPHESGIVIRILGKITDEVRDVIFGALGIVRKNVIGASFSGIRKY